MTAKDIISEAFENDNNFPLEPGLQFLTLSGSHAYGLADEYSDLDYIGVVVPPKEFILGLNKWEHWNPKPGTLEGGIDVSIYSLDKFIRLLYKQNPNIVETLFFYPSVLLYESTDFTSRIVDNRDQFATLKLLKAIKGFANGELQRLKAGGSTRKMGAKRREAVEEFGYNVRAASHVLRLLFTANNWLRYGNYDPVLVGLDREEVLAVKKGRWSYGECIDAANDAFERLNELEEQVNLPKKPDFEFVNNILITMNERSINASN